MPSLDSSKYVYLALFLIVPSLWFAPLNVKNFYYLVNKGDFNPVHAKVVKDDHYRVTNRGRSKTYCYTVKVDDLEYHIAKDYFEETYKVNDSIYLLFNESGWNTHLMGRNLMFAKPEEFPNILSALLVLVLTCTPCGFLLYKYFTERRLERRIEAVQDKEKKRRAKKKKARKKNS